MTAQRDNGIIVGEVVDLKDPENLGRVKVTYPVLDDTTSDWARLVSLMAGPDRGAFFRPEPGDEVLVCFEQGDPRRPYVIGAMWSAMDKPPADDGGKEKNNWRFFRSRSGHMIKFDDTKGAETIELIDKDEKHKIIIDAANKKIQVICDDGDVEVQAKQGLVKVDAKNAEVEASENIKAKAKNVEVKASQSIKAEATSVELKASGEMKLEAGGTMTIKGATVNIN